MRLPRQGRRIVWLVRALTIIGLLMVCLTLGLVGVTLGKIRAQRAQASAEQERLHHTSGQFRQLSLNNQSDLQACLDETAESDDFLTPQNDIKAFVTTQLAGRIDPAVAAPLNRAQVTAAALYDVSLRGRMWRARYNVVWKDISRQETVGRVRQLVTQLRNAVDALEGRRKLEEAIQYRKWRNASGDEASQLAKTILDDRNRQRNQASLELSGELAEFARLAELLNGAEQFDGLSDLKDNQFRPLLDRMARTMGDFKTEEAGELNPRDVEALKAALFGEGFVDDGHQNIQVGGGGLYALRRDALQLRREREKLKGEAMVLFQDLDAERIDFDQVSETRTAEIARQVEKELESGWRRMLVFGGITSLIFLWLAWMISRSIRIQVRALEQARAEAETGRLTTHKLMLEQQASAAELEKVHAKLLEASRQAGMAEIATSVLHNVGNVLNSVNISVGLATTKVQESPVKNLALAVKAMAAHPDDLDAFLTRDERGRQIPAYLSTVSEIMTDEQTSLLAEMASLTRHVEHIKQIVQVQQQYAKHQNVMESVDLGSLLDDTVKVNSIMVDANKIQVVRDYADLPPLLIDKHAVLQILINLVSNAKHALMGVNHGHRQLTLRTSTYQAEGREMMRMEVTDNGMGIDPANLTRIFNHGFTTKKEGHGFGLHSSANSAKQMHGSLTAKSDGPGTGATFTLDLPLNREVVTS